jgi:hypothetical protein
MKIWGCQRSESAFFQTFGCQKLPKNCQGLAEHLRGRLNRTIGTIWTVWTALIHSDFDDYSLNSSVHHNRVVYFICNPILSNQKKEEVFKIFVQIRILNRASCLCEKTVQIQGFRGESDQSKLEAPDYLVRFVFFVLIEINHRHLPISRRTLKQNTENLLSKILYQPSPKYRRECSRSIDLRED